MTWLAVPLGALLGAAIQSPLFWGGVLISLLVWRARRGLS